VLPASTKPISADDHIIEHPHVWTDRLPERLRAAGPHVVELDDGRQVWAYEDELVKIRKGNALPRDGFGGDNEAWIRFDEMRPGCYDPKERLADMDRAGVWASLGFPDFARFSGHRFLGRKDPQLALQCVRAYNDYVLDEWCATAPERLMGTSIVPYWDLPAARAELERVAQSGARALAFSEDPTAFGLPSIHTRHWDPLWAAVSATGLPVCMHIGSSGRFVRTTPDAPDTTTMTVLATQTMCACADWLFSGVFERFPSLRVIFSEGGAGWAPFIVERAEKAFGRYGDDSGGTRSPAELFAEHVYVCIVDEPFAVHSLADLPVDNLLWETDYPHESGSFPDSRKLLEHLLRDVSEDDAVKIAESNACRLFHL
jgi:predicted TIM-barrel fold metal-dependent hydrolase